MIIEKYMLFLGKYIFLFFEVFNEVKIVFEFKFLNYFIDNKKLKKRI